MSVYRSEMPSTTGLPGLVGASPPISGDAAITPGHKEAADVVERVNGFFDAGTAAYKKHNYKQAVGDYTNAINVMEASIKKNQHYFKNPDTGGTIDLNPIAPESFNDNDNLGLAYFNRALAYQEMGQPEKAYQDFKKALGRLDVDSSKDSIDYAKGQIQQYEATHPRHAPAAPKP